MRPVLLRAFVVVCASVLLAAPYQPAALGARPRQPTLPRARATGLHRVPETPGAVLWVDRYKGEEQEEHADTALAASPDGTKVYVTGNISSLTTHSDYATIAYDAATGARIWGTRSSGSGNYPDFATAVAVSPDATKVYVTGMSYSPTTGGDYATVAYDAATGARVWARRYNGPGNSTDSATAVAMSSDGTRVYVTGSTYEGPTTGDDYATIAYDAATGARVWARRYNGPGNSTDDATAVAVSSDGTVYVTGTSYEGPTTGFDYATLAYDGATGVAVWGSRYNDLGNGSDYPNALGVSPDGSSVYVTGTSYGDVTSHFDYATVAYDGATGVAAWVRRYNGPGYQGDGANALAVSPDGTTVYVTGSSYSSTTGNDYATIAYDGATGARLWLRRYNGPANESDSANAVAVSPDGMEVYVTGGSYGGSTTSVDYATIAYDASSSAPLWGARYNGPVGSSVDDATELAVSPDGTSLYVTGSSGPLFRADHATIAYSTG